mmetsp:Transcript_9718/g.16668  ORF Transcript_9718/g.16668 Transcript_9718/m.16668 type:complete len:220 (-) Transcript_9718:72-731(-)
MLSMSNFMPCVKALDTKGVWKLALFPMAASGVHAGMRFLCGYAGILRGPQDRDGRRGWSGSVLGRGGDLLLEFRWPRSAPVRKKLSLVPTPTVEGRLQEGSHGRSSRGVNRSTNFLCLASSFLFSSRTSGPLLHFPCLTLNKGLSGTRRLAMMFREERVEKVPRLSWYFLTSISAGDRAGGQRAWCGAVLQKRTCSFFTSSALSTSRCTFADSVGGGNL